MIHLEHLKEHGICQACAMSARIQMATQVVVVDGELQSLCTTCHEIHEAKTERPPVQNSGVAKTKGRPTLSRATVPHVQGAGQAHSR